MSDDQLRRWFEQFQHSPAEPMRMPPVREIRRRVRVWWATRLGGALAVAAVVVWAGTLLAGQVGGGPPPNGVAGPPPPPTGVPVPVPTGPPSTASRPPTMPTLPHPPPVTSPASDTFRVEPTSVRAGQTATLRGQGCRAPGVTASRLLVQVDVHSPDTNFRVAWLEYPVRADGSWQGQWRIPTLPGRIRYGPGFQLQPSCVILSYRGRSKYDEGVQNVFAYDLQRLTIKPPM
jgi:hypothetical protein